MAGPQASDTSAPAMQAWLNDSGHFWKFSVKKDTQDRFIATSHARWEPLNAMPGVAGNPAVAAAREPAAQPGDPARGAREAAPITGGPSASANRQGIIIVGGKPAQQRAPTPAPAR